MFNFDMYSDSPKEQETAGDALKDGLADRKPLQQPWDRGATQTTRRVFVAPHDNGGMEDGE